jgi:hypothetical protein
MKRPVPVAGPDRRRPRGALAQFSAVATSSWIMALSAPGHFFETSKRSIALELDKSSSNGPLFRCFDLFRISTGGS